MIFSNVDVNTMHNGQNKDGQMHIGCEVSVIIPAYNCRKTIKQAIESVLMQDVSLELIVIEDGSEDSISDIMAEYQADARVTFVQNPRNMGVSATRNRGVQMARGRYVAFLDADDYWREGKLFRQVERIRQTDTVLCSTARELMKADGQLTGRVIPVKEEITYQDMLHQNWINNSSVLVKRRVLMEFPLESDEVHEDYLLWLKILKKYERACAVNEPFLVYRLDHKSKSGNKLKSAVMTYKTYRKLGFGRGKAIACFLSYAVAGIRKYYT